MSAAGDDDEGGDAISWGKREERRLKLAKAVPLQVKVCRHQRRVINEYLQYGIEVSEAAAYDQQECIERGVHAEHPAANATPKQLAAWVREAVRCMFWREGATCPTCGHVATGLLTEHTPEDANRWGIEWRGDELEWLREQSLQRWEHERTQLYRSADASEPEAER